MGMSCQDNACASGYGLWATMGLGKLEELFHFLRSQVKRGQWGVMTHGAPPSLVGKHSHRTGLSLSTTHQPMPSIPQDCMSLSYSFPARLEGICARLDLEHRLFANRWAGGLPGALLLL